jgi:SAM-dependent methyltransferase
VEKSVALDGEPGPDRASIRKKIDSYPRWHYEFDLAGEKTPIHPPNRANAHEERKRYFFDPLTELCGGSLEGKRVLDLGSNAGFWSLEALERRAEFVLGVDGRAMHIEQAEFVFEVKGIDKSRYEFAVGNVFTFDYSRFGEFDIVLCLGLMYHVNKPVELMEVIARVNKDICVIDTLVSLAPGSYFRLRWEDPENPLHSAERDLVMSPTRKAMVDLAESYGYSAVILHPEFESYRGAKNYRQGRRRSFLCTKKSDLSRISAPVERVGVSGSPADLFWVARDNARSAPRRLRRRLRA